MNSKAYNLTRLKILAVLCIIILVLLLQNAFVFAADLSSRSITVSSSFISENVNHRFRFRNVGNSDISSIRFQYCTNSPVHEDACTAPAGLNVNGFTISAITGISGLSKSVVATNASTIVVSRPMANQAPSNMNMTFSNIINPSTANQIVYVRISVFDNVDATGTMVDRGSVAFVTEDPFNIAAYVPPYLTFCSGVNVALDCSTSTGVFQSFGEFSNAQASAITTQFSASTNDGNGYNTYVSGQTMTSGNNIINPILTASNSIPGSSQFGINLRANTNPAVGSNPEAGPVASGTPDPDYNTPNTFRFVDGDRIAGSADSTGFNRYTVSYIVNIPNGQAPGTYASTITYTAIASF